MKDKVFACIGGTKNVTVDNWFRFQRKMLFCQYGLNPRHSQIAVAISLYSASAEDRATVYYFLELQDRGVMLRVFLQVITESILKYRSHKDWYM